MSPAPNFEPGDFVTLKSGGPVMSVKSVGETSFTRAPAYGASGSRRSAISKR